MAIYTEEVASYIWRNGEILPWAEATIHVNAVGHASVAGIFEGIKAYWNEERRQLYVFRLDEHLERFVASIKMVRYGFDYTLGQLRGAIIDLLRANEYRKSVYIRPYVFQKGMVRELLQPQPGKPTELVIDSWPFASYRDMNQALNVCVSSWTRISDNVLPPRLKCFSNYHNGRLAAMEATVSGYDIRTQKDAVRSHLGILVESAGLYSHSTTREHLRYVGNLHGLDGPDLERRLLALPGIGDMKAKALLAILGRRFGVELDGLDSVMPNYPTLADVDSAEALVAYQEKKRAYKAKLKAQGGVFDPGDVGTPKPIT